MSKSLLKLTARTFVYNYIYLLSRDAFAGITRGEIFGAENIPKEGPFILAGNHLSFIDPPAFGVNMAREAYYFARSSLFKNKFSTWLLKSLNTIPVNRESKSEVKAIRTILTLLKEGNGVLLFPEGTRSKNGELQEAKSGIGLFACKTKVPVIPARIFGSNDVLGKSDSRFDLRYPMSVHYGKPLLPEDYDPGADFKNRYQEAADRIMNAIAGLKKEEIPNF